jgi:hypothetical protein
MTEQARVLLFRGIDKETKSLMLMETMESVFVQVEGRY